MKRIKRLLSISLLLFLVVMVSACSKNYNSITYKRFQEKMGDELNYAITDKTLTYEDIYQRYYSAINNDIIFTFYELKDEDSAKDFVEKNYNKRKYYSYKSKDNYSEVKSTKTGYFRLIQVDNIIISASSEKSSDKSEINKAFEKLGY